MIADVVGVLRKEQGAAKTLGTIAVGVVELRGGVHAQAHWAQRGAIWIAPVEGMTVLVEWYDSNAPLTGSILVDLPRVEDSISGDMGGKVVESEDSTLMERAKRGDIVLSEG